MSLTEGATDGTVSSIAVKGNRLYAATIRKGIQVVDLDQVTSEFHGTLDAVINHGINTAGQGFAMDAVIANIGIQNDPTFEYLDNLFDIKVADYTLAGQNETLAVATGWVPLGSVTSPAVSFIVADPNTQTIVSKTTPQSGSGKLLRGQALALGQIQTAGAASQNIAATVGGGSATNCASCNVLAVIDMTDPTSPQPLSFTALSDTPTDVVLKGNTAIVGYSSDTAEMFDLTDPTNPQSQGKIVGIGGKLFIYNFNQLFSTGIVIGNPSAPLGGVHSSDFEPVCTTLRSQLAKNPPTNANSRVSYPLQSLDWTINSGTLSARDGFVLTGVSLGSRLMANTMSLPYLIIQRDSAASTSQQLPSTLHCELSSNSTAVRLTCHVVAASSSCTIS